MSSPRRPGRGRDVARAARRRLDAAVCPLEPRCLMAGGVEPTADEQYAIQLINRARANPAAEGDRLVALAHSDPTIAASTAGWDLNGFLQQIRSSPASPPLAVDPRLVEAARAEDAAMLAANDQRHSPAGFLTNPAIATATDGRAYFDVSQASWSTGENIFAFASNVPNPTTKSIVDYYHAGLLIDWGNPDYGHLKNLLAPGPGEAVGASHLPYSVVGVGLLAGSPSLAPSFAPANPANRGLNVGPVLETQEFGWRTGNAYLTGAIYRDADNNHFYTPGEGLGGIVVTAVGRAGQGAFQTTTWAAGGYSLQLPPGQYDVTATGGGVSQSTAITVGADNVGWDVNAATPATAQADVPVPGDYDGDHRVDNAVYRPDTGEWLILQSTAGPRAFAFGAPNTDIPVPADYDGDGKVDPAVYRPSTGQWFILQSTAGPRAITFGGPNIDTPVPADYDGDGKADPAVYRAGTGQYFILQSAAGPRAVAIGAPNLDIPVPGDYDGDGKVDPAVFRPADATWRIGQPGGGTRVLAFGAANLDVPVPGDYDGDHKADMAVYRPTTGQWLILQSTAGPRVAAFGAPNTDQPLPMDRDADGRVDPTVFRPSTAQWFSTTAGGGVVVTFGRPGVGRPPSLRLTASAGVAVGSAAVGLVSIKADATPVGPNVPTPAPTRKVIHGKATPRAHRARVAIPRRSSHLTSWTA